MRALLCLFLSGCVAVQPADLGWTHNAPDFQMKTLEWNVVANHSLLASLCGLDSRKWKGQACAIRIREKGQCVVFSTMSAEEAKRAAIWNEGWSLYDHEMAHCAGWGHQ